MLRGVIPWAGSLEELILLTYDKRLVRQFSYLDFVDINDGIMRPEWQQFLGEVRGACENDHDLELLEGALQGDFRIWEEEFSNMTTAMPSIRVCDLRNACT